MVNDQAHQLRNKMKKGVHVNAENAPPVNKHQAHTIAIFSGKGGVGKSNFALNFGLGLCKQGKKVLIFDLDIGMGNVDILLGVHPIHSLTTMLEKKLQISDIIEQGPDNLSYVAAGTGLTDFFHMNEEKYNYFVQELDHVTSKYDYILFDLGAGMTEEHMAFINSSDECFVVTTTEPPSITDAYAAIKQMVIHSPNVDSLKLSLLVNRVESKQEMKAVYEKLEQVINKFLDFNIHLLGSLPDDPFVTQAVKKQVPFIELDQRSAVSKTLFKIVLDYLRLKEEIPQSDQSFINKLTSIFKKRG
ncbi:MinD/ParA family protein [Halalkalibacillus halophilus]|uniref:MinD/ParA family protein n=1 Tax=Halalkalibacillus halophilus TaxID=392827 RepID=UPI00041B9832|nr:MinD/ParA family protein [Halalkalibacillus halophilus]